jgi:hypothetical protein
MEGQHRDPQLEKLRVALKNLQWRIARIKEAADINTRCPQQCNHYLKKDMGVVKGCTRGEGRRG